MVPNQGSLFGKLFVEEVCLLSGLVDNKSLVNERRNIGIFPCVSDSVKYLELLLGGYTWVGQGLFKLLEVEPLLFSSTGLILLLGSFVSVIFLDSNVS